MCLSYSKKEYSDYVERKSQKSPIVRDTISAFIVGGLLCCIGQFFLNLYTKNLGLDEEISKSAVSVTMIFLGSFFTGLDLYKKIAKYAGAGTIVPITGFANSIVSPAMEFRREGMILGLAAKMFVIAGPVLVYGISTSVFIGIIYYIIKLF
ncbi:MAG: stage V sporulation protein AC [Ruminococcaceae bacterium]|nr:stage V sporulation protein AC [Oscillospiraceae bacterium]